MEQAISIGWLFGAERELDSSIANVTVMVVHLARECKSGTEFARYEIYTVVSKTDTITSKL